MAGSACSDVAAFSTPPLLRRVPLNIAQVITSAQFVGVVIAASLVLDEPISPVRWVGIACIGLGIALVGLTANI